MEQYKIKEDENKKINNNSNTILEEGFKHSEYVTAEFVNEYEEVEEIEYKTSKYKIVTIVFTVISLIVSLAMFSADQIPTGIVSGIQTIMYLLSILFGEGVFGKRKKKFYKAWFWFSLLLTIPFFVVYNTEETERLIWQDLELGEMIPEIEKEEAIIYTNSESYLTLTAMDVDYSEYKDYVDSCKEEGYEIGISSNDTWYMAYNEEGYEISIYYYKNKDEMNLNLSAPIEKDTIEWPETKLTDTIPVPESDYGSIVSETSEEIKIVLGEVSKRDYKDFVNDCIDMGYDVDKEESENSFEAYNSEGYHLVMSYHEHREEHSIQIIAPLDFEKITWPDSDIAKALPKPDLSKGVFEQKQDYCIKVYIGDTTYEEFEDYVEECKDKGFDKDAYEYDNYFNGENRDGDDLTVRYVGNKTMYISVYNYDRD